MVTIYNAISLDGFIATKDDNTDWVKDWDEYEAILNEADCVIYGRRTYDDMVKAETFPLEGIENIVYTWHPQKYNDVKGARFSNTQPQKLIEELNAEGFENILVAGGGRTNATFLNDGVVDRIIVDLHPLLLGEGIKLISSGQIQTELILKDSHPISNGLLQLEFDVVKNS